MMFFTINILWRRCILSKFNQLHVFFIICHIVSSLKNGRGLPRPLRYIFGNVFNLNLSDSIYIEGNSIAFLVGCVTIHADDVSNIPAMDAALITAEHSTNAGSTTPDCIILTSFFSKTL